MAFKSFKYKFYSKGYHCSAAQKSATAFFDSSYQYLRRNQGLVNQESSIPSSHAAGVNPHPVVVANVNYSTVEHILQVEAAEDCGGNVKKEGESSGEDNSKGPPEGRRASVSGKGAVHAGQRLRSRGNNENLPLLPNQKNLVIDQKLSQSYYSTTATDAGKPSQVANLPAEETRTVVEESSGPWEPDTEEELNVDTFLQTQTTQIRKCHEAGQYDQINALYQSLKRNNIVPPLEVYSMVIESVCKRELDNDNIDNRMFQLLNCYQDLLNNKLKPTDEIYNMVIGCLLNGSIVAYESHNPNGLDFYKIGADLFQASNARRSQQFSKRLLDCFLLSMNLYPGYVQLNYVKNVIHNSSLYTKSSFYYVAMISYAARLNDNSAVKELYSDFRTQCLGNENLKSNQFEVYSAALSGLVETGDMALAIKLLDKVLADVREKNGMVSNLSLVLSSFLISVSKVDPHKSYNLWLEFRKLKWFPELSYDFYLTLLANSLKDWELSKRIYDYIFPMTRSLNSKAGSFSEFLLKPMGLESVLSSFLDYALQLKDAEVVMKVLEESIVKSFKFEVGIYPFVFQFLKSIQCPDDYLLRFIASHGSLMKQSKDKFEFLNGLIDSYQSQVILTRVTEMKFFTDYCRSFNPADSRYINHSGLIACFQSLWRSPQIIEKYLYNLELHGLIIGKIYDLDNYYNVMENEYLVEFKSDVTEKFKKLVMNYKRLSLDPTQVSGVVVQGMKAVNLSDEFSSYFTHPGDWDKSYPLSLGSLIRTSLNTGIKTYQRLYSEGYCFDYDTYKELIYQKVIDETIITKAIELCPDEDQHKYLSNCLVVKTFNQDLESKIVNHPMFESKILPYLKDSSLLRIAKNTSNTRKFAHKIQFPKRFKSIAVQAENRSTIGFIYEHLFLEKDFDSILKFNKVCPVLDVSLLLKSCVRSGNYDEYEKLYAKFKNSLGNEALNVHAEYLVNLNKIDEAICLIKSAPKDTKHKSSDLLSFALFLKSFKTDVLYVEHIENTLQLANVISIQQSFSSMISVYQTLLGDRSVMQNMKLNKAVNLEIAEQMLNNLCDALQFVDLKNEHAQKVFFNKLKNYLRFRVFLKLPELNNHEFNQILELYCLLSPPSVDRLFNNIVETIYLNSGARQLYLQNDLIFKFTPEQISNIVDRIGCFYHSEKNEENEQKAEDLKKLLNQVYPVE